MLHHNTMITFTTKHNRSCSLVEQECNFQETGLLSVLFSDKHADKLMLTRTKLLYRQDYRSQTSQSDCFQAVFFFFYVALSRCRLLDVRLGRVVLD